MRNKKIRITFIVSITFSFFLLFYLGLSISSQFNNFIFSNVINPFNPLKKTELIKYSDNDDEYWKDPRGLFPIFAYNVPDKTKDLRSSLKIIENGGINIVINGNLGWMPDPYKVKEAFSELNNSNLRWIAILENECKDDFVYRNVNDRTNKNIKEYLIDFNDESVYGWYIWDEPGINREPCSPFRLVPNDDNEDINRMTKQIRSDSSYNNKLDFVNLFPRYWDVTPDAGAYENYIEAYISSQEYKPRLLCIDHYPLLTKEHGGFRQDYFSNLDIARKKANDHNIPLWMIVLSSGHLGYKNPTFEEISFQVFSALAYGAKGIGYFLYSKSMEMVGYKSWILEENVDNLNVPDSLHGPLFVPVKKLNAQVQILGDTLLNLKSIEVIHSSDYPNKQKDISESVLRLDKTHSFIRSIKTADGTNIDPKVLIGILKNREADKNEGTYLMVVNKNVTDKIFVDILLNDVSRIYIINKNTGESKFIYESDVLEVEIFSGSGELFYCE
jgi:hypothetical protein